MSTSKGSPKKRKAKKSVAGSALKVWLIEQSWRWLLALAVIWLVVLFHTTFTEAAEFRAQVVERTGRNAQVLIPGTQAPNPEHRWTSCWDGRELLEADLLRTGGDSTVTLGFTEASYLRINPATQVQIARLGFDRQAPGRQRLLKLERGSLVVRTGTPSGTGAAFVVETPRGRVTGFNAAYTVDPSNLVVVEGTVTVEAGRPIEVAAGNVYGFLARKSRQAARQELDRARAATDKLPAIETADKARLLFVDREQGWVLSRSGALLKMIGHDPGEGNPLASWGLVNSSRRGQSQKRLADIVTAMTGQTNLPGSVRLDDLKALGVDNERIELIRKALYRGQLMSYQASGDRFRISARAVDRQHTLMTATQAGVQDF